MAGGIIQARSIGQRRIDSGSVQCPNCHAKPTATSTMESGVKLGARVLRGGMALALGEVGGQGLSFVRNLIIARLIGPDDFGIAATFAVTVAALEMASDLSPGKLIIQAADGDDPDLQATAHALQIVRGVLIGAVIFASADVVADIFGVPDVAWAYRWLALVPVLRGFSHLDWKRVQRHLSFGPEVVLTLSPLAVSLVAAVSLAVWLRSFEAMLWALVLQSAALLAGSHIVARRRYGLGLSSSVVRRAWRFGWPLMVNGLLIFSTIQGDRLLVGASLGVRELAIYTVASLVVSAPSFMIMRVATSLYLPMLSAARDDPATFVRRYRICGAFLASLAIVLAVPFIIVGNPAIVALFGPSYSGGATLVAWLAVAAAARIFRTWPTTAALATGETRILMYANVVRVVGLLLAYLAIRGGHGPVGVAASIAVGEMLATCVALFRANMIAGVSRTTGWASFAGVTAVSLAALLFVQVAPIDGRLVMAVGVATAIVVAGVLYVTAISKDARSYIMAAINGAQ